MEIDLMKDFVNETVVELKIKGRTGFKYKPVTAGQENEWINEYIVPDEEGKGVQDLAKLNKCKMRNLVGVPYTKEHIEKILGEPKEWKDLNHDQRWKLLQKINPNLFSKIILAMNKVDGSSSAEEKKN